MQAAADLCDFPSTNGSLTSVMSHIYFALNGRKDLNTQTPSFVNEVGWCSICVTRSIFRAAG